MKYDSDLRWARTGARGMLLLNLAAAGWNAYRGNWAVAVACVVWAGNCVVWLSMICGQQRTRDQGRIIESAVLGTLRGAMDCDDDER